MSILGKIRDIHDTPVTLLAVFLAASALFSTLSPAPATSGPRALSGRFGPGEYHELELKYGPVTTGRVRFVVGADTPFEGETVWPILFQARTSDVMDRVFAVDDRFVSHWSPTQQATRGFDFFAEENGKKRVLRARLDSARGVARVQKQSPNTAPKDKTIKTGPIDHDAASAIFWLRQQPLADGEEASVRIFTGSRALTVEAKVVGRETRKVDGVPTPTVKVALKTGFKGDFESKRPIHLWFTDDESHVLTRIEAEVVLGSLSAELVRYAPGARR